MTTVSKVNLDYTAKEIDSKVARNFIKKFHYSGKVVPNSKLHIGIHSEERGLVGVLSFGYPMNGKKTAKKLSDNQNMMELNRMAMDDDEPKNAESKALSITFKYLKQNYKDLEWILSFSDGKENNCGYIYQATNWDYLGYHLSKSFYDLDGSIMHSVTVWHRYKEKHPDRNIKTTHEILYDNFLNVSVIFSKQHIYCFKLKKSVTWKHKLKPYPKIENEIPIPKQIFYKKDNKICIPPMVHVSTNEPLKGIL